MVKNKKEEEVGQNGIQGKVDERVQLGKNMQELQQQITQGEQALRNMSLMLARIDGWLEHAGVTDLTPYLNSRSDNVTKVPK